LVQLLIMYNRLSVKLKTAVTKLMVDNNNRLVPELDKVHK